MPVAVISDVHGNLPALRAALSALRDEGLETVLSCGDLASGPLPTETLDELMSLPEPFRSVRGNADRGAVEAFDGTADPLATHEDDVWTGGQLTPGHRDYLSGLPTTITLTVDGVGEVMCCHGSPRRDDEIIVETTPDDQLAAALEGVRADVVVCGNTHMPFDRRVGGHRVVNVGSVGWPYGTPGAYWAILGPDVEFRRTAYDSGAAERELRRRSRWPRLEEFIEGVLLRPPSRQEAIDAFTRMAAQQREP